MKALWCAREVGADYERLDYGGAFGKVDEADYLAKNPNGRIPTMEDGDITLWESNVIVRYMAEKYGSNGMFPGSAKVRWNAEKWMDWQQTTLNVAMSPAFWGLVRTPPEKRDRQSIQNSVDASNRCWLLLDRHLAKTPYIVGDQLTMADIPVGCGVYRWFAMEVERPKMPHVNAWYQRLQQRPAFCEHVMQPLT